MFAERGFAGTSLQDVAAAAGLKRPALYYYVKSKEDLLDKLIVEATSGPAQNLIVIGARKEVDPAERLHAMAYWIVEWVATHSDRFLLLIKSEADLSPASAQKFTEGRRVALDAVIGVINEGIESGAFRRVDARVAAFGVWGLCNWTAWWYRPDGPLSLQSIAQELADMAVESLRRPQRRNRKALSVPSAVAALREGLERLDEALLDERRPRRDSI